MGKAKFWVMQVLIAFAVSLILGGSAFAKGPEHSKGNEMKNAHASDVAKSKANSNAGFGDVADTDPSGDEGDAGDDTGSVDYEAACTELFGSAAYFNWNDLTCINFDTFEVVQF